MNCFLPVRRQLRMFATRTVSQVRRFKMIVFAVFAIVTLAGCVQTISPELRYLLAQPVRCETATGELALLREIRPDGTRQVMTVVGTLSPPGIAGMIVTQDFENRRRVVSGEHGADIDRRVADIQAQCGAREGGSQRLMRSPPQGS